MTGKVYCKILEVKIFRELFLQLLPKHYLFLELIEFYWPSVVRKLLIEFYWPSVVRKGPIKFDPLIHD